MPDLAFVRAWFGRYWLAVWFGVIFVIRASTLPGGPAGFDGELYLEATRTWLAGGDPWSAGGAVRFAAPPPTLLVLAPIAMLPPNLGWAVMVGTAVAGVVWTVRLLRLPWWWLLFPPFLDGAWNGNPQTLLVPLILVGAGPLAVFLKLYAIVPIGLTRWRALAVSVAALVVTAPLLPWGPYVARFADLSAALFDQSNGGLSASALPLLIPVGVIALALCGREKAAWLAVPVLWPSTQWYYATLAVPAIPTHWLAAALLAIPVPGLPVAAAVVVAWQMRLRTRRALRDAWVPLGILGRP